MIKNIFKKLFGTRNQRMLREYSKTVEQINALGDQFKALSNVDLSEKTKEFRQRYELGETLDQLLPEAFATVREASWRILKMRHFDVQLIGGIALHKGKVAEMRTGEGKTLCSTLPAYLNAIPGKGVHVVTVNDYLAERDANWMRPIYEFLGMSVGINPSEPEIEPKKAAYAADITYGTNNEFGFDYLRDNMAFELDQQVQRPLHYAIIDEVDSILIDEARTPLIISGQTEDSTKLYKEIDKLIPRLTLQTKKEDSESPLKKITSLKEDTPDTNEQQGDYTLDEKTRQAHLTENGHQKVEEMLRQEGLLAAGTNLYDATNISLLHYFNAALRAHTLYTKDVDYIVKNKQVIIVDEHTGRLMEGRRWSDGLHQAVEAKEGVEVETENQTMATITFQNYFRLYEKLSGMTGTADTEAFELQKIYGLEVVVIPTNKPTMRVDHADKIFLNLQGKCKAILKEIRECRDKKQPVLIGTASIESSEFLSELLTKEKIPHEVLNAKNHSREAKIIAQAGRPGAITIATNMAGRGTDIVLGGNIEEEIKHLTQEALENNKPEPSKEEIQKLRDTYKKQQEEALKAGGLHLLGTERNESRRIDNQLRGRSGRQGDPGSSQFFLSLDDNLLRIFAAEKMAAMMQRLGVKEDDVIQHSMISRSIENAQRRVEGMNFDARKQLLEYDDVANDQRKVVYQQRHKLLQEKDISAAITDIRPQAVEYLLEPYMPPESTDEQWDIPGLEARLEADFSLKLDIQKMLTENGDLGVDEISDYLLETINQQAAEKEAKVDLTQLRLIERQVMLQLLDQNWRDHLAAMDHLRQSIHLRGYAQKNPAQEYKRECFDMFTNMLDRIKYDLIATLARVEVIPHPGEDESLNILPQQSPKMTYTHQETSGFATPEQSSTTTQKEVVEDTNTPEKQQPFTRQAPKSGRNDPCPCGSDKKYKHCCGKIK